MAGASSTANDDAPASSPLDLDVLAWRYDELGRAGYPAELATILAGRPDVDLHLACSLLAAGATAQQALRILT